MKNITICSVALIFIILFVFCGYGKRADSLDTPQNIAGIPHEYDFTEQHPLYSGVPGTPSDEQKKTLDELYTGFGITYATPDGEWPDGLTHFEYLNGFVLVYLSDFSTKMIAKITQMVSSPGYLRFVNACCSRSEYAAVYNEVFEHREEITDMFGNWLPAPNKDSFVIYIEDESVCSIAARYFKKHYGDIITVESADIYS